jgi:hypothetical protein
MVVKLLGKNTTLVSTRRNCWVPCSYFGSNRVVGFEGTTSSCEILGPGLMQTFNRWQTMTLNRFRKLRTACHGGLDAVMSSSFVGASFRMCESHECHSGGTCVALKSCYTAKPLLNRSLKQRATNLSKVHPSVST